MLDEGATIKIPEFAYDALGRRIRKSDCASNTNTLYYYNDNWQVLCEYNGGGNFERMFMYGNYIDEPIMTYSGGIYFYVQDHLYSTAALVDTGGNVTERYEYDAYGQVHILDADFADDADGRSDCNNPYMFTGRRVDLLDGGKLTLQINRHRYYDYYTGRWLTQDLVGMTPNRDKTNEFSPVRQYEPTLSLYESVGSNPLIFVDPDGLTRCEGGEWWVAGTTTTFGYALATVEKALLKLVCKQSKFFGQYKYCCCGVKFDAKLWRVPYALLDVIDVSAGPALGIGHFLVTGEISGEQDPSELRGLSLSGPGASVSVLLFGVSVGGGSTGAGGASGYGPSVSISILGGAYTRVEAHGYWLEEENLGPEYERLKSICCCTKKFELKSGAWEETPLQAKPVPHPGGFSTREHPQGLSTHGY